MVSLDSARPTLCTASHNLQPSYCITYVLLNDSVCKQNPISLHMKTKKESDSCLPKTGETPKPRNPRLQLDGLPTELLVQIFQYVAFDEYMGHRGLFELRWKETLQDRSDVWKQYMRRTTSQDPKSHPSWIYLRDVMKAHYSTRLSAIAASLLADSMCLLDLRYTMDAEIKTRKLNTQMKQLKELCELLHINGLYHMRHLVLRRVRFAICTLSLDTTTAVDFTATFILDISDDGRHAKVTVVPEFHHLVQTYKHTNHTMRAETGADQASETKQLTSSQLSKLEWALQDAQEHFRRWWESDIQTLLRNRSKRHFDMLDKSLRNLWAVSVAQRRESFDFDDVQLRHELRENGFMMHQGLPECAATGLHGYSRGLDFQENRMLVTSH
ncbi:hypothetical protein EJ05DRAFT_485605 [Pseudovirgaria hyperparasitica]|uniref:F-box domain-containing protein n=1 Tax=Pseudovirgaria hyperparasitica TaxID=470096 RepID=A0A6A6WBJ6_9PEZI|nr:uncharacterized protein EJ05DRAFT_485605 [Pseudovirgaria hyperparasitica]KAF2758481.1 hypothetical protein EJ05DRAFT_485605 [Pseudovirgaria hyperparasitica]